MKEIREITNGTVRHDMYEDIAVRLFRNKFRTHCGLIMKTMSEVYSVR